MRNKKLCTFLLVWCLALITVQAPVLADNESSNSLPVPVESSIVVDSTTVETSTADSSADSVMESSINIEESNQSGSSISTEESAIVTALSEVILSIEALPEVDETIMSDEEQIDTVRKAYDDLTSEDKANVWNYEKLQKVEEKIILLKETSGYSYTFTLTQQSPTVGLLLGFPESEEIASFLLTSPSGMAIESNIDQTELNGDGFHASIMEFNGQYKILIDKAELGNWLLTTKDPISFSVIEYIPENSSSESISEALSSETVDQVNDDSSTSIYDRLLKKALTKEGLIVIAVVAALILFVIILLIIKKAKKRKAKKETSDENVQKSKDKTKKKKAEQDKEVPSSESQKAMTEEEALRANIEKYMREKHYDQPSEESKPHKTLILDEKHEETKKEPDYLEPEELDNDVTLVEYADSVIGPTTVQQEQPKPRRRQSFFTDDRFGN